MASFPSLSPATRTFSPGAYPHTAFAGMSGLSNRVRHSNVMLDSELRLTFVSISEAQMLSILAHYNGQQGGFQSFLLPADAWSGVATVADYQLAGYGWIYKEAPQVEDLPCGDHNVTVVLATVPPEGTALLGGNLLLAYRFAPGVVQGLPGASLAIAYSLTAGVAAPAQLPGASLTIGYSLTPGVAQAAPGAVDSAAYWADWRAFENDLFLYE